MEKSNQYINIKYQEGPIKENGVNGCQVDDVIAFAKATLKKLNKPPYECDENWNAIAMLSKAQEHLGKRTKDREDRDVEGTSQV